ncbi:hypothetical protein VP01_9579g1, partial [Puccinia sorghi]
IPVKGIAASVEWRSRSSVNRLELASAVRDSSAAPAGPDSCTAPAGSDSSTAPADVALRPFVHNPNPNPNADSSGDSDANSSFGDRELDADFSGASDDIDSGSNADAIDSGSNADAIDSQSSDCGRPGCHWASQEQLKIIRNMMKARNMKRFHMDFNLPLLGPENTFCLELARDTFVALLECGEYDGLQPHESKPE